MSIRAKKLLLFLGLTFVVNYLMVYIYLLLAGGDHDRYIGLLATAYMLVPMIMALIVQKGIFKQPIIKPLGISFRINRWFFVAWLLPPVIAFATMGASLLLPGITFTPDLSGFFSALSGSMTPQQIDQVRQSMASLPVHPVWMLLLQGLLAGTTINAILAFGEELGWRGFLQKELGFMGFWKSAALIGVIWGVWHAPLVLEGLNYPKHPQLGILIMTAWCLALSPLFSYIRLKSGSVIAASIFHGTLNAVPGLALLLISGGNELTVGITGLAGFIVIIIADILVFIFDRFITRRPAGEILHELVGPEAEEEHAAEPG